ncbi:J domain-containing protein [Roseivirga sp. BDSF3-8]|uniref:J domain-containing protein n=1 Tax=Roseivirga sp. BDSF3-8 TaxID=3241598 RepID=UPI003531BF39
MSDFYAILAVERNANQAEIKKAYHKLAKLHHPDKSKKAEDRIIFERIAEAYRVLGNPEKRTIYDRELLITEQFTRMQESMYAKAAKGKSSPEDKTVNGKTRITVNLGYASAITVVLSLLIGLLLALDYTLAPVQSRDTLFFKQSAETSASGGQTAIFTANERVEVGQDVSERFPLGSEVMVEKTPILGSILSIELMNEDDSLIVSERLSPVKILLPFVLLILALGTYLLKNKPTLRAGLLSVYSIAFIATLLLLFS